jgi:hypothetical protein
LYFVSGWCHGTGKTDASLKKKRNRLYPLFFFLESSETFLHALFVTYKITFKSPQPPFSTGGRGGIKDFHRSCLHAEVPAFRHAGVGVQSAMDNYTDFKKLVTQRFLSFYRHLSYFTSKFHRDFSHQPLILNMVSELELERVRIQVDLLF